MKIVVNNSEMTFVTGVNVEVEPLVLNKLYFNDQGVVETATTSKRKIYYYKAKAGVPYNMSAQCAYNPSAVAGTFLTIPSAGDSATTFATGLGSNIDYTITPTVDCYIFLSFYDTDAINAGTLHFIKNYSA